MSRNGHPPRPTSITPPQILSLNHEERYRQLNPDTDDDNSHDSDDDYYRDLELDDDEEEEEEDEDNDEERNFSYRNYLDSVVPPPLPLIDIAPDESSNPPPNTINGCSLRSIEHIKGRDFEGDKLYDPLSSR